MLTRNVSEFTRSEWDVETDILIIGAGGAGLTAGLAAAEQEVDVRIYEKEDEVGGNTGLATGAFVGADTILQREAGIEDSPEKLLRDIFRRNERKSDEALTRRIAEESGPTIDWLIDVMNVQFRLNTGPYRVPGHSVNRSHFPVDEDGQLRRTGSVLIDQLVDAADRRSIDIRTETPIEQLIVDDDGTVVGALTALNVGTSGDASRDLIRTKKILLATDGFGANYELRAELIPETLEMEYWGSPGCTGEAIKWGKELGAQVEDISYLAFATVSQPQGVWIPGELVAMGSLFVNAEAEQFIDTNDVTYPEITAEILDQSGAAAYQLFDRTIYDTIASSEEGSERFSNCVERGVFESAETIRGLAEALGLNPVTLDTTVKEYISDAGEEFEERPFSEPPFYGTKIKPTLNQGLGGLKVDRKAQVLRENDEPIPNLFAGGGATTGITGGVTGGYLPGNGLMTALVLGRIMGETAANQVLET